MDSAVRKSPNQSAAGKAGIARRLTIGHLRPGLPEPWSMRILRLAIITIVLIEITIAFLWFGRRQYPKVQLGDRAVRFQTEPVVIQIRYFDSNHFYPNRLGRER